METLVQVHNTSVAIVSRLAGLATDHEIIRSNLDSLNSEHDLLDEKLMTIASELESVKKNLSTLVEAQGYKCGGTFGWRRVSEYVRPKHQLPFWLEVNYYFWLQTMV